jgi:methyl-accepting chemotaxis protein
VSAATEEQSATMEEIAAGSQALAKLAVNLQAAVSRFQI